MKNRARRLLCKLRRNHSTAIDCEIALVMMDSEWFEEHIHFCRTCGEMVMAKVTRLEPVDLSRLFDPGLPAQNQRGYMN